MPRLWGSKVEVTPEQVNQVLKSVHIFSSTQLHSVKVLQWRIQGEDEGDASPLPAYSNFLHVKNTASNQLT